MAYIERRDLRNELYSRMDFYYEQGYHSLSRECSELIKYIDEMPTADVEVVRHGEWIWTENGEEDYEQFWVCSVCKEKSYIETKFCSDCGAKMDGGKDENV